MTGMWSRILLFLTIKTSAVLDRAEDPRQTLDYACGEQRELLRKVRHELSEVATSKRQLKQQSEKLRARVPQLEQQAKRALAAGREDLARLALQRKQTALLELSGLDRKIAEIAEEGRHLTAAEERLSARIGEFRTPRAVVSARNTAAEAQARVKGALSGVSEELSDLWQAVQRAEDKTERMQARVSSIGALVESGALSLPGLGGDVVERELRDVTGSQAMDAELAVLRGQLREGPPWRALGSGS